MSKEQKIKRQSLSDVELDEVSLVDNGANQEARVLLYKRAGGADGGEVPEPDEGIEKVSGVQFILGFPEGGGSSEVQSVLFDADDWEEGKARRWLKEHDFVSDGKLDETENKLRFRQSDPGKFARFRVIAPGQAKKSLPEMAAEVAKASLTGQDGLQARVALVMRALTEQASDAYVVDVFDKDVVFRQGEKLWRASYVLEDQQEGISGTVTRRVVLGVKVPVEIRYQEVAVKRFSNLEERLTKLRTASQTLQRRWEGIQHRGA